jgi:hypothetical protein
METYALSETVILGTLTDKVQKPDMPSSESFIIDLTVDMIVSQLALAFTVAVATQSTM